VTLTDIQKRTSLPARNITRTVWRNFASESALAKCIAAGKDLSVRGEMRKHPDREGESIMRTKQNKLFAGVAALALFAASGIALAQQGQQDRQGAGGAAQAQQSQRQESQRGQHGARNQSANQGARNQSAQQGKNQNAMSRQSSGQNAEDQSRMQSRQGNAGRSSNRSAQEQNGNRGASTTNRIAQGQHNQRNAQSRTTQSGNGQFANQQRNRTQRSTSTAQRNEQLKGLQGSTRAPMQGATSTEQGGGGGANVSLNDQQRTQIRESIINSSNAPRVRNQLQREHRHRGAAVKSIWCACRRHWCRSGRDGGISCISSTTT